MIHDVKKWGKSSQVPILLLVLIGFCGVAVSSHAAIALLFDSPSYDVQPGQSFQAQVLYDADPGTSGNQPVAAGLYSAGVSLAFPSAKAEVLAPANISLVSALNSDGTGNAPFTTVAAGSAGAAGAEALSAVTGYTGTLLATFTIHDLAPSGSYVLNLSKYFPSKANFVDFNGNSLDNQLTFGSATVNVLSPEPSGGLAVLGCAAYLTARRRRRFAASM